MLAEIARHAPLFPSLLIAKPQLTFPLLRALWRSRAIMAQFFMSEVTVTGISTQGEPSRSPTAADLTFSLQTVPGRSLKWWKGSLRRRVCRDGASLQITVENEHSPLSRAGGEAWDALETAIEILFERAVIAPLPFPLCDGRTVLQWATRQGISLLPLSA